MKSLNGEQLYGLRRILKTLKVSRHKELKNFSLKQKLALNYVSRQSKMTLLDGEIYSNTFTPVFPSLPYDRYLRGLKALSEKRPVPLITNFAVTAKCPCNCWHCSFSDRSKKRELSLKELSSAFRAVQELGTAIIGITGGEPLLRKDLEQIIEAIGEPSMPLMFTTGFKLTKDRVKSLKQAGLKIPVISLDHYRPERHDAGRGRDGMFHTALKAIELFKDEGFYVALSFVPDRELVDNREELEKVIDFFKSLGVNDMRLTSPILSGQLTAKPEEKLTAENRKTLFEIQKKCVNTKGYPGVFSYDFFEREEFYGCCAGFNYLFIDSSGNCSPCDFTMISFGNILERPVDEIWAEMSNSFSLPGCTCYANRINDTVAVSPTKTRPLPKNEALKILKDCPPYDKNKIPEFFRRLM